MVEFSWLPKSVAAFQVTVLLLPAVTKPRSPAKVFLVTAQVRPPSDDISKVVVAVSFKLYWIATIEVLVAWVAVIVDIVGAKVSKEGKTTLNANNTIVEMD